MINRIAAAWEGFRTHWDWLAPVVALVCLVGVGYFTTQNLTQHRCAFCPLRLDRLEVRPSTLTIGEPAQLLDGLCNTSNEPVFTSITLILEPEASALSETTVVLSDSQRSIDPKSCPAPRSLPVAQVPANVPPGHWRLTARIIGRSSKGGMQIITRSSNYFEVRPMAEVRP